MLKRQLVALGLLLTLGFASSTSAFAAKGENWKGQPDAAEVHLGVLSGLSVFDFTTGFALLGTASKKIIKHGFVSEISDSVSIETALGPIFTNGTAIFSYSLHMRWDFEMNEQWTFYALGGAGGYIAGNSFSPVNNFALFPRFGFGAFFRATDLIMVRGEISHELIGAGVTIPFYL